MAFEDVAVMSLVDQKTRAYFEADDYLWWEVWLVSHLYSKLL